MLGRKLESWELPVLHSSTLGVMLGAHVLLVPKTYHPAQSSTTPPSCWAHDGFADARTATHPGQRAWDQMLSPHSSCWPSSVTGNKVLGWAPGVWQHWECWPHTQHQYSLLSLVPDNPYTKASRLFMNAQFPPVRILLLTIYWIQTSTHSHG